MLSSHSWGTVASTWESPSNGESLWFLWMSRGQNGTKPSAKTTMTQIWLASAIIIAVKYIASDSVIYIAWGRHDMKTLSALLAPSRSGFEPTVEKKTDDVPMIWDLVTFLWRHCKVRYEGKGGWKRNILLSIISQHRYLKSFLLELERKYPFILKDQSHVC